MAGYNVLSYFDGMSCGQLALKESNIKVNKYFACEIDKYAMQVTMKNFPKTKQLGSVTNVDLSKLPKIDLFIGGSPCQGFSFAGSKKGMVTLCNIEVISLSHYLDLKESGFKFDGQSYLFWEYVNALNFLKKQNPDIHFLLENVRMNKKLISVISKSLGVNPIMINSSLLSSQNRERFYWTNIGMKKTGLFNLIESTIKQPIDKKIYLKDILESNVDDKYFLSEKFLKYMNKNNKQCSINNIGFKFQPIDNFNVKSKTIVKKEGNQMQNNFIVEKRKAKCFTAGGNSGGLHSKMDLIVHNTMPRTSKKGNGGTGRLKRKDGKTYCLNTGVTNLVEFNNVVSGTLRTHNDGKGFRKIKTGKGAAIPARAREDGSGQNIASVNGKIRRLTPLECERLQTVPDNYTNHVSDTQRYKMLGNGWTVDVISHIFNYLK